MSKHEEAVRSYKQFLENLMPADEEGILALYDTHIHIIVGDKLLTLPFSATPYNAVVDLLNEYIENEL